MAALALVAGCGGPAKDAKHAEGDDVWSTSESQAEMARRFPAEPTAYSCLDADLSQRDQVGGEIPDEFEPTERKTTFAIDEHAVTEIDAAGSRREYRLTEFEFPPLNGYTLGATYLDCTEECKRTLGSDTSTDRPAVVLLDDVVYVFDRFDVTDGSMFFNYACARGDAVAKLRSTNADGHRTKLFRYNDTRERSARAAAQAKDEKLQAEANARQVEGWKAEAEADRAAAKAEQEARLARARNNIASITARAGGDSPNDEIWIVVTAQLTDGSSMDIRSDDAIYDDLFDDSILKGQYKMIVEVRVKDDTSIKTETDEIAFTFAKEHRFGCQGAPGATGVDTDWQGAMNFSGRRGDDGPTLTVEITATGVRTGKGNQLLRYRLSCQERTEVFTANATALVSVVSAGGKGGHGVPRAYGATADGSDGGNGGDGGTIQVIVDPSVETYNLKTASPPGDGGNGSEATDAARAGNRGKPGAEGSTSTRKAPVEIP